MPNGCTGPHSSPAATTGSSTGTAARSSAAPAPSMRWPGSGVTPPTSTAGRRKAIQNGILPASRSSLHREWRRTPRSRCGYWPGPGGDDASQCPSGGGFSMLVGLFRPASRGRLSPTATPSSISIRVISPNPWIPRRFAKARARAWNSPPPARLTLAGGEWKALPADRGGSRDFVRRAAGSYRHPVGTCVMGTGPEAVVDPRLRARGITNLRIVDNSVMPPPATSWHQPWPLPKKPRPC